MAKPDLGAERRPDDVEVRPYLDTDDAAVVAMAESAHSVDPGSPHLDSSRWRYVCTDPHADPENRFQVAQTRDGTVVGLAYRFDPPRHDGGRFRAVFVVVEPGHRRGGIGSALYHAVACEEERDPLDEGWHLATTVDERSQAGLPFARAMGFKKASERYVLCRSLSDKAIPEVDCEADIEPFLGASAYRDWASIHNAAFSGVEGATSVTADELEDNRPEDFRPEHVQFARIGKERVGVLFMRETSTGGFVETLAVRPESWGKGIATALLCAAMAHLCERGHGACELVVDDANAAALSIFGRLGFDEVSRRSFLVKRPRARRRKQKT